jgi:uncharacterized protein (DUF1800 family)
MINKKIKHLIHRASFGFPLEKSDFGSVEKVFADLWKKSAAPGFINVVPAQSEVLPDNFRKKPADEKSDFIKNKFRLAKELNAAWLNQLQGTSQLREKMTLFWANHFACRSGNPAFAQFLNNKIREHALGNFRTLLIEVSRSPAMLQFLNNQQNRKSHPNENFAREVMELFTLGRGHYSEKDVQEAARAFTGWSFNLAGEFEFRNRIHDFGQKTILNRTGNFNGDDVLRILLEEQQTALFITRKFWRAFVSNTPDEKLCKEIAVRFYDSGYEVEVLLRDFFLADWFYDDKYIGALIKSPVELMVPLLRDFRVEFVNPNVAIGFQKALGQILFNPPNVAGWTGGRNWIDSSSLAFRMRMGRILLSEELASIESKPDGDDNNAFRDKLGVDEGVKIRSDWKKVEGFYSGLQEKDRLEAMADYLLAVPLSAENRRLAKSFIQSESSDKGLRSTVLFLTTLPEFQIC